MTNRVIETPREHYFSTALETVAAAGTKTTPWQRVRRAPAVLDAAATTLPAVHERLWLRGVVYGVNPGTLQVQYSPDNGTTVFSSPSVAKPLIDFLSFNFMILLPYVRLLYTDGGVADDVAFLLFASIEEYPG